MNKFKSQIQKFILLENKVLKNNGEMVAQQNKFTLQAILLSGAIIFISAFLGSILSTSAVSAGYGKLSIFYLIISAVAAIIFFIISVFPNINQYFIIYLTYTIVFCYCTFTSALVSSNYVSVAILSIIFQIPILFLDKSIRINLFVILGTSLYLTFIFFFKKRDLLVDEIFNCIIFAFTGIIMGTFTRYAKMENISVKAELNHLVYFDGLTEIYNRRKLFDDLQNDQFKKEITGIGILDVDFFKKYNDTYGHQQGDKCLKSIINCIAAFNFESNFSIYRYGGEEFVVLFKNTSKERITTIADTIRLGVESMNIDHKSSDLKKVTISIGIALVSAENFEGYEQTISNADLALYTSKSKGRNCVTFYAI